MRLCKLLETVEIHYGWKIVVERKDNAKHVQLVCYSFLENLLLHITDQNTKILLVIFSSL